MAKEEQVRLLLTNIKQVTQSITMFTPDHMWEEHAWSFTKSKCHVFLATATMVSTCHHIKKGCHSHTASSLSPSVQPSWPSPISVVLGLCLLGVIHPCHHLHRDIAHGGSHMALDRWHIRHRHLDSSMGWESDTCNLQRDLRITNAYHSLPKVVNSEFYNHHTSYNTRYEQPVI
jgi:hypothetical protein